MSEGKADKFQRLLLAHLQKSERRKSLVRFARIMEGQVKSITKKTNFYGKSTEFEPNFDKLTLQGQKARRMTSYRPTFIKSFGGQTTKVSNEAIALPKVIGMSAESNFNDFYRKRVLTEPTVSLRASYLVPEQLTQVTVVKRLTIESQERAMTTLLVPTETEPRKSQLRLFQKVLKRETIKQIPVSKRPSHKTIVSKSKKSYWMRSIDDLLSQKRIENVHFGYYRTFRMEEISSCDILNFVCGKVIRDIEYERMRF